MDRQAWWNCLYPLLVAGTAAAFATSCSSDCRPRARTYCQEGISYWVDSCGKIEEIKEQCTCGCDESHTACLPCGCTCSQVGDCCDGCQSLQEGEVCDDHDPETINDLCNSGVCAGWNPADVAMPDLPAEPALPAAPEPVQLRSWTCPPGWNPVAHLTLLDENGQPFSWCEPPPLPRLKVAGYLTPLNEGEQDGDRPICEPAVDGTYPEFGFASCQPLGDPCPAGEWPDVPAVVTGNRIYVRAGAAAGDGSQAAPFGTIAAAVAAAAAGDVVVIGSGTYTEALTLSKDITLWGSCVQRSVINSPGPSGVEPLAAFEVSSGKVSIRNLQISGAKYGVLAVAPGALALQGVWIHAASSYAVKASGGGLTLANVLVDTTQPDAQGYSGLGLVSLNGSQGRVERSTLENNRKEGVDLEGSNTHLDFADVAIRNTVAEESSQQLGTGLQVVSGASGGLDRVLVGGSWYVGLLTGDSGTRVTLNNVIFADSAQSATPNLGLGVSAVGGGRVSGQQVLLVRNRTCGVLVDGSSSAISLDDFVIRDMGISPDGSQGVGVQVQNGGPLTLSRGLIENCVTAGGLGMNPGSVLSLADVAIRDIAADSDTDPGWGMEIYDGARASWSRGLVEHAQGAAIDVEGSTLELTDVNVLDTLPMEPSHAFGHGLEAASGAQVNVTRGRFDGNAGIAIMTTDQETVVQLEDVTSSNTHSDGFEGRGGYGLSVLSGGKVVLRRGLMDANHDIGIDVVDPGSFLDAEDLTVRDTKGCESNQRGGIGIQIFGGSHVILWRGLFERNHADGIFMTDPGTVGEFRDVTVRDTTASVDNHRGGYGFAVWDGSRMTLDRGLVASNQDIGIFATRSSIQVEPPLVDLADVTVRDTKSSELAKTQGIGLAIGRGVQATLHRAYLLHNRHVGLVADDPGTLVEIEDLTVEDTQSEEHTGMEGRGLECAFGATVSLTRGRFEGNREISVSVFSEGSELDLSQIAIHHSQYSDCRFLPEGDPGCSGLGGGTGLGAYKQSNLFITGVEIDGSVFLGIQLADLGAITGRGLSVVDNSIGINIQKVPAGYDFYSAVTGLWMSGNATNFDSTLLPVPDPGNFVTP